VKRGFGKTRTFTFTIYIFISGYNANMISPLCRYVWHKQFARPC